MSRVISWLRMAVARWWMRLFWWFCGVVVLNDSYVMREGLGWWGFCGVVMT